ncbi:MAG: glycosyltransferase family 4 protein [Verrucomicrobiota bacterium]
MNIALLHYAYVPTIGGVEFVMEQHAGLFARHGHAVKVVCGSGASDVPGVSVSEVPELGPGHEGVVRVQEEVNGGESGVCFGELKERLKERLRAELSSCEVVFVHNVMTMHFNLAATAALGELAQELEGVRFVNWVHDLAAINPDYEFPDLGRYPWELMGEPAPGFEAVIISKKRQRQYCDLMGVRARECPVIPNGIEVLGVLKLTQHVHDFARRYGLLYADIVMIHPTRIVRRKNVEYGIRVLAELKKLAKSCAYLVTGAPDPHNAEAREYGEELKALIQELDVERQFHFVSNSFRVSDRDLRHLYSISDVLFLPSRQEGFGLPLLEAGLFRIPVFCPALEPMRSILEHNVNLFDLEDDPAQVAGRIVEVLDGSSGHRARKEVMRNYCWERLFNEKIEPRFFRDG